MMQGSCSGATKSTVNGCQSLLFHFVLENTSENNPVYMDSHHYIDKISIFLVLYQ